MGNPLGHNHFWELIIKIEDQPTIWHQIDYFYNGLGNNMGPHIYGCSSQNLNEAILHANEWEINLIA